MVPSGSSVGGSIERTGHDGRRQGKWGNIHSEIMEYVSRELLKSAISWRTETPFSVESHNERTAQRIKAPQQPISAEAKNGTKLRSNFGSTH